jgi:hypothetical protein
VAFPNRLPAPARTENNAKGTTEPGANGDANPDVVDGGTEPGAKGDTHPDPKKHW